MLYLQKWRSYLGHRFCDVASPCVYSCSTFLCHDARNLSTIRRRSANIYIYIYIYGQFVAFVLRNFGITHSISTLTTTTTPMPAEQWKSTRRSQLAANYYVAVIASPQCRANWTGHQCEKTRARARSTEKQRILVGPAATRVFLRRRDDVAAAKQVLARDARPSQTAQHCCTRCAAHRSAVQSVRACACVPSLRSHNSQALMYYYRTATTSFRSRCPWRKQRARCRQTRATDSF